MQFRKTVQPMFISQGFKCLWVCAALVAYISFGLFSPGIVAAHSRAVSLDYLIENSDLVVSGTVVGKSMSQENILVDTFSGDGKGNSIKRTETWNEILTDYEIEITDVIRGTYGKHVIHLTVTGGVVDGQGLETLGTFYLKVGEKYHFFLIYEQRNDKWWAVASEKGVLSEVEKSGESFVGSINGRSVLDIDGKFVSDIEGSNEQKLEIEQFIARIKTWSHE